MKPIIYRVGDATTPEADGPKIIAHICNNRGAWGAGFVLALSHRWSEPEREYRRIAQACTDDNRPLVLGTVHFVPVEFDIQVANMIAQNEVRRIHCTRLVDYQALTNALIIVQRIATRDGATVHMPRIGCGLGGGKWRFISEIINETLGKMDVQAYVYDLPVSVEAQKEAA